MVSRLGETTFFPDGSVPVTEKTPMGYPVDVFQGQDVDLSFGSEAAMYRDKARKLFRSWVFKGNHLKSPCFG